MTSVKLINHSSSTADWNYLHEKTFMFYSLAICRGIELGANFK